MYDISNLRPDELLDEKNSYMFNKVIHDINEFFEVLDPQVKSTVIHELFCIVLKYDPNY